MEKEQIETKLRNLAQHLTDEANDVYIGKKPNIEWLEEIAEMITELINKLKQEG